MVQIKVNISNISFVSISSLVDPPCPSIKEKIEYLLAIFEFG